MKKENYKKLKETNKKEELDSIVTSVMQKYKTRAMLGKEKYETDMDREDLSIVEWLKHAQEETMDSSIYLEKLIQEYDKEIKWYRR